MPLDMWALLSKDWSFGLSHALACVLLAESLSAKQVRVVGSASLESFWILKYTVMVVTLMRRQPFVEKGRLPVIQWHAAGGFQPYVADGCRGSDRRKLDSKHLLEIDWKCCTPTAGT